MGTRGRSLTDSNLKQCGLPLQAEAVWHDRTRNGSLGTVHQQVEIPWHIHRSEQIIFNVHQELRKGTERIPYMQTVRMGGRDTIILHQADITVLHPTYDCMERVRCRALPYHLILAAVFKGTCQPNGKNVEFKGKPTNADLKMLHTWLLVRKFRFSIAPCLFQATTIFRRGLAMAAHISLP